MKTCSAVLGKHQVVGYTSFLFPLLDRYGHFTESAAIGPAASPEVRMNHSTRKQIHEQNRKRHKLELEEHKRLAARRGRSRLPLWLLILGTSAIIAAIVVLTFG
jgi:hypothetical protein